MQGEGATTKDTDRMLKETMRKIQLAEGAARLEGWRRGYAQGVAEARGLGDPCVQANVRTVVSHHGSDCAMDHPPTGILPNGYCRGIVLIRRDFLARDPVDGSYGEHTIPTTESFLVGDYPEGDVFRHYAKGGPSDPIWYGGGFWDRVEICGGELGGPPAGNLDEGGAIE